MYIHCSYIHMAIEANPCIENVMSNSGHLLPPNTNSFRCFIMMMQQFVPKLQARAYYAGVILRMRGYKINENNEMIGCFKHNKIIIRYYNSWM